MKNISYQKLIELHNDALVEISNKYKLNQALNAILVKFYSNINVYNHLYWEQKCFSEAKIILRSAIESVVLFSYLICFPKEISQYEQDSLILEFKNNFLVVKEYFYAEDFQKKNMKISQPKLLRAHSDFFNKLNKKSQNFILKEIKENEYFLNENNIETIDKFFRKFKPKFQKLEEMYNELKNLNNLNFNIREYLFTSYNQYSQIQHNSLYKCISRIDKNDILLDYSLFKRLLLIIIIMCNYNKKTISYNKLKKISQEFTILDQEIKTLKIIN